MNSFSIVGISVLSAIFFGALITMVIILRKRLKTSLKLIVHDMDTGSQEMLVEREGGSISNMGVDNNIYMDEEWMGCVSDKIEECTEILKTSQGLTEEVIKIVLSHSPHGNVSPSLVEQGRQVSIKADQLVKALYPPYRQDLLEDRSCRLVLEVSKLVMLSGFVKEPSLRPLLVQLYDCLKSLKGKAQSHHSTSNGGLERKNARNSRTNNNDDDDELILIKDNINNKNNNNINGAKFEQAKSTAF